MQCTSYFPGCYYVRDIMGSSGNSRSICNTDIAWRKGVYNVLLPLSATDQYLGYEKELFKQTILSHEATFRDQVAQLHRLYRRQKELMDELKEKELSKCQITMQASQSNHLLTQIQADGFQKVSDTFSWPTVYPTGSVLSGPIIEGIRATPNTVADKRILTWSGTSMLKAPSKDCNELSSGSKKTGKTELNLELPADEYIDNEEKEWCEEKTELPYYVYNTPVMPKKDSKLNAVQTRGSSSVDLVQKKKFCWFDLNEPIQPVQQMTSTSSSPMEAVYQEDDEHGKSKDPPFLDEVIVTSTKGGKAVNIYSNPENRHLELLPSNSEIGKCGSRLNCLQECPSRTHDLLSSHDPIVSSSSASTSDQLVLEDGTKTQASPFTYHRKMVHNSQLSPTMIEALPCVGTLLPFNERIKSSGEAPIINGDQFGPDRNVAQSSNHTMVGSSMTCGLDSDLTSEHVTLTKCIKILNGISSPDGIDLNFMPPHSSLGTTVSQGNIKTMSSESELKDSTGKAHCPSKKPVNKGEIPGTTEFSELPFSAIVSVISHSDPYDRNRICEQAGVPDSSLLHNTCVESKCSENDSSVSSRIDNEPFKLRTYIDLNSCTNHDEPSEGASAAVDVSKIAVQPALEAPVSPDNKESSPPRGESEDNQCKTPICLSDLEKSNPLGALERIAAEVIVLISTLRLKRRPKISISKPSEVPDDCLHWFAETVSAVTSQSENEVENLLNGVADSAHSESLHDTIDYFEAMTLKLTETKIEDSFYRSNIPKEKETTDITSSIRPKRGRARSAWQRKDFQTEVLPCLASLSWHQVNEDLQTIGSMMVAADTVVASRSRRSTCKSVRARHARHCVASSSTASDKTSSSHLKPHGNDSKRAFTETCLTGWGNINRRQRNRRVRPRNTLVSGL